MQKWEGRLLDELDKQIIKLLQENGRKPYTEIASELGVSEGTIRKRLNYLINSEVIRILAVADPAKIGFNVSALIGIKVVPGLIEKVVEQVSRLENITWAVMTTGSFDLIIEVFCRDNNELAKLLTKTIGSIEGIRETQTFMILKIHKLAYKLNPQE
jgi:Lrp/AsnC family transcriptional regulator for asnA, asnC and gidA